MYAQPWEGDDHGDTGFRAINEAEQSSLDPETKAKYDKLGWWEFAAERLKTKVYSALPRDIADVIVPRIALGALDTGTINAAIYRSSDRMFAILLNSGLMLLLNKAAKILIAQADPSCVIYCNRTGHSPPSVEDLQGYLPKVIET